MAELLTEGNEREQELERLGWALEEAGRARGLLEAEVGRLWALLGGETPPTGPPEPPPTVPEPGPPETPATGPLESPPTIPELGPPEAPATSLPEPPPTIPEPSPPEPPTTPAELPSIAQEPGPSKLPSPTPPELPCPPELPLGALELAVAGRVWDAPVDTSLLMGKQAWHSEQAQLQNAPWELQKPTGQAGLQEQEVALSRLLQENRALRAELALWQSQGRAECAASVIGDGQHQGTSSPPAPVTPGGRGQGDLAYVLQTPWPAMQDAQTQTEGLAEGGPHKELISAAFDHTQYEPYGLPEVVMKGFADIPSGPSCPYVLRRGFLGSTPLAPLAPKAEPEEDPRA
ncbi:uncharacterized protein [Emydura macquarii macquarii]|uniref:uncharacterized protein isoform X2 n=1 Tax=Emydura macquarii macquarii TaxID=1129001 RepID=UPI00352A6551